MSTIEPRTQALPAVRTSERLRPARRVRSILRDGRGLRVISPLVFLAIWQLSSTSHLISPQKLPPPSVVWNEAIYLITHNSPAYGTLQGALAVSLGRFAIGFAIGGGVALILATCAGLSRIGEVTIDPLMQMVRTLPLFGLIPVFVIWFGIGVTPKVLLIALAALVPLYLNAYSGIHSIDARHYELARALGLSRRELLRKVVFPGALPQTLVGVRQSTGTAILALIVAEQINASGGLGFLMNQGMQFDQMNVIFVGLLVYMLLGLVTDWFVRRFERRVLRWRGATVR